MSRMFEQVRREKMNQTSRKIQINKFEMSRLKSKRTENIQTRISLKAECVELDESIARLAVEMTGLEQEKQQIEAGQKDFEIQAEVYASLEPLMDTRDTRRHEIIVQPRQVVRSVSASRPRDMTINPRYACSEFYKNFGSDTRFEMRVRSSVIEGYINVDRRVIISDVPIGSSGKTVFKSLNEWVTTYMKDSDPSLIAVGNAYKIVWYQEKATNEWVSLMSTAVVGNVIN